MMPYRRKEKNMASFRIIIKCLWQNFRSIFKIIVKSSGKRSITGLKGSLPN